MWYIILIIIIIVIGKYLKSPAVKGRRSEQAVARKLNTDVFFNGSGRVLTNIYVPRQKGDTTEIDVLYITCKGLIVIENKNYAGYIFGTESHKNWTVTLYAGKTWLGRNAVEKHQFYNPIWQNNTHIKYLKEYLGTDTRAYSIVTFDNRGDLKDITVNSPDVHVCNHAALSDVINEIWRTNQDVLDEKQIEEIYLKLKPLTNIDEATKEKHVQDIQKRFSSTDVCPVCGGKLVLRTAKKGPNAGNQFYGCENYPKCKYTRNV